MWRKYLDWISFLMIAAIIILVAVFGFAGKAHGQNTGYAPSSAGISIPSSPYASLPLASTSPGVVYYTPDNPAGPSLVLSDGTTWRTFARGIVSQSYTLTSADAGAHTFNYTNSATPNIQVTLVDNTTTGMLTDTVTNPTSTSVKVTVSRGSVLPGLATSLLGFNPFAGGTTTGVTINLLVFPVN